MAMGTSAKWGGDGLCIVIEFELEFANGERIWMLVGVQRGERVMW